MQFDKHEVVTWRCDVLFRQHLGSRCAEFLLPAPLGDVRCASGSAAKSAVLYNGAIVRRSVRYRSLRTLPLCFTTPRVIRCRDADFTLQPYRIAPASSIHSRERRETEIQGVGEWKTQSSGLFAAPVGARRSLRWDC